MRIILQKLARDESGASILEMGLTAPFLGALLIGMIDLSNGYSQKLQLEQAAQRSIEKVMQGSKTTTMYNTLKAEAAATAGVPQTAVTVDYWLECNGTRQSVYESNCTSGQTYMRYIEVEIQKQYTPIFPAMLIGGNNDGTFTLNGTAGIRVQ